MPRVTKSERNHKCPHCDCAFTGLKYLYNHVYKTHPKEDTSAIYDQWARHNEEVKTNNRKKNRPATVNDDGQTYHEFLSVKTAELKETRPEITKQSDRIKMIAEMWRERNNDIKSEPVEPVEPIEPIEPVEPVKPVEPVEAVKPIEQIEAAVSVEIVEVQVNTPIKTVKQPNEVFQSWVDNVAEYIADVVIDQAFTELAAEPVEQIDEFDQIGDVVDEVVDKVVNEVVDKVVDEVVDEVNKVVDEVDEVVDEVVDKAVSDEVVDKVVDDVVDKVVDEVVNDIEIVDDVIDDSQYVFSAPVKPFDGEYDEYLVECYKTWKQGGFARAFKYLPRTFTITKNPESEVKFDDFALVKPCLITEIPKVVLYKSGKNKGKPKPQKPTQPSPSYLTDIRARMNDLHTELICNYETYCETHYDEEDYDFDDGDWIDVGYKFVNEDNIHQFFD